MRHAVLVKGVKITPQNMRRVAVLFEDHLAAEPETVARILLQNHSHELPVALVAGILHPTSVSRGNQGAYPKSDSPTCLK